MTPEFAQKVAALFQAIRTLPADERLASLEVACAGDEELRAEVLALLAADEEAGREGFLDSASGPSRAQRPDILLSSSEGGTQAQSARDVPVSLVLGSGPHQATRVEGLFHRRMRIGVLVALLGFGIFLLKNLFLDEHYANPMFRPSLWVHIAAVIVAAVMTPILWCRRTLTLFELRAVETALLMATTIFFAVYQAGEFDRSQWETLAAPGQSSVVLDLTSDSCLLRWCAVMVFYAFFVPNTLRRSALVLGVVALCPVAVTVGIGLWEDTLTQFGDVLQEMTIWLGLTWVMAVYGSHKIAELRREAFEARKLGQYRLRHRLGSGGMGEVWLAEHDLLKRPCAIKLIRSELVGDPTTLSRFQREVQATAMLSHPNTVRIYDYGIAEDGTFYYTMEYLPGLTLQELVEKDGPVPPERAVSFLRRTCSALREAHALGLIHRDLKPGNFIVSQLGGIPDVLKLLDFGLVRNTPADQDHERLSLHGYVIGTPAYLSPEQASGRQDLDARSDIYSLGAIGYFLLSGHPPFAGKTPHHVVVAHLEQSVPPLGAPGHEVIPADVEAVIRRCLEKDPSHRFPDVVSLDDALSHCACADEWTQAKADCWWRDHAPRDRVLAPATESGPAVT